MRFLIGVLLGFAVGLAGAILFAPERTKSAEFPEGHPGRSLNGDQSGGLRGALRTLQDHVNEAWEEARVAAEESEKEMMSRYQEARMSAAEQTEREMRAIYEEAAAAKKNDTKAAKKAEKAAKKESVSKK